jgi:hypothetical protein
MNSDLLDILKHLAKNNVSCVIIGGYAAIVYGSTLATEDMDVCCDFSPENLLRLQKALSGLHPVHRMTPNRKPLELTPQNVKDLKNLYIDTDLGTLDCLGYVNGIGEFKDVLKSSRKIEVDGVELNILTLDALIKAKEAMQRPHDKQTLIQLKAIREQSKNGK